MPEKNAIGVIELASLHKGFEVQNEVLENTHVEKMLARTICSGKYLILVRGEIADVEACIETAKETGAYSVINALIISNIDDKVFPAIAGSTLLDSPRVGALLIIETFSVAAAIKAADIAAKEADVNLLRIHVAMAIGGKGLVVMTGSVEALQASQQAAMSFLKEEGTLCGSSLITDPHEDVLRDLI